MKNLVIVLGMALGCFAQSPTLNTSSSVTSVVTMDPTGEINVYGEDGTLLASINKDWSVKLTSGTCEAALGTAVKSFVFYSKLSAKQSIELHSQDEAYIAQSQKVIDAGRKLIKAQQEVIDSLKLQTEIYKKLMAEIIKH